MQPVFAYEELLTGQACEIEVIDAALGYFLVGVATAGLKNAVNQHSNSNSLGIFPDGRLVFDGKQHKQSFEF